MSSPSELNNAKGILAKTYIDQINNSCVGGTSATYRITDSLPANSTRTYSSVIPLKTPCFYGLSIIRDVRATDGSQSGDYNNVIFGISQVVAGAAAISPPQGNFGLNAAAGVWGLVGLLVVTPSYNAVTNAIDILVSTQAPTQVRPCEYTIIFEVLNSRIF